MKLWLYVLLTWLLKQFGAWRYRVGNSIGWQARWERDRRNIIPSEHLGDIQGTTRLGCCDCELDHALWVDSEGLHLIPWRPRGFHYK